MGLGRGENISYSHRNKIFCNSPFNLTHLTLNLTLWKNKRDLQQSFSWRNLKILNLHNYGVAGHVTLRGSLYAPELAPNLQSSQVKRTPQDPTDEFIIRTLNPLVVVDFRLISAFLHAKLAVNSHARLSRNFYQLSFPEFDVNVF